MTCFSRLAISRLLWAPLQKGGWLPNGLEMSRPASAQIVSRIGFDAAGRVGSIELLGSIRFVSPHTRLPIMRAMSS